MQVIINVAGQGCPDTFNLLDVGDGGAQHPLQSPEVAQQGPAARGSQSRDAFEDRLIETPCAPFAVAGDREAMGFIAHPLDQS